MNKNTQTFAVSVLLHRDGDAWVAQCLEYDLAAQGVSPELAKQRFLHALTAQIISDVSDKKEPLSELGQAPQRYFDQLVDKSAGPDLPVFVPVLKEDQPRVNVRARFFEKAVASGHA